MFLFQLTFKVNCMIIIIKTSSVRDSLRAGGWGWGGLKGGRGLSAVLFFISFSQPGKTCFERIICFEVDSTTRA